MSDTHSKQLASKSGTQPARSQAVAMKRVREPFGHVEPPNSATPAPASSSKTQHKRGRQQQYEQQTNTNNDNKVALSAEDLGPFRALLAANGVVWAAAPRRGMVAAAAAEEEEKRSGLGFPCRCSPAKLRLGVEKALVHDQARRREFVEVGAYGSAVVLTAQQTAHGTCARTPLHRGPYCILHRLC